LRLPDELTHRRAARQLAAAGAGASAPSSAAAASVPGAGRNKRETWYGFYPNGREILLVIDDIRGRDLNAVYAIGPGIDENEPAEWSRRKGRLVDDEFVFDEKGKSTLRFRPRADGGLSAVWTSPDGKTSMQAGLRPLDLLHLSRRAEAR
jgi:hypothetical protein